MSRKVIEYYSKTFHREDSSASLLVPLLQRTEGQKYGQAVFELKS